MKTLDKMNAVAVAVAKDLGVTEEEARALVKVALRANGPAMVKALRELLKEGGMA